MNIIITSKDEILKNSRELIRQQGWPAVNIRSVARACDVSVGCIYNYFGSKAELVSATVESVWYDIFHLPQESMEFDDTQSCITWIYERMEYGCEKYPGFFTLHSFGFGEKKSDGKQLMYHTWEHIVNRLEAVLKHDTKVRPNAFNEQFTIEKLSNILFSLILSSILRQDYDPSVILEIIHRTIY